MRRLTHFRVHELAQGLGNAYIASMLALIVTISCFILFALLESFWPRRGLPLSRRERWLGALSLVAIGGLLSRLILPIGLVGIAVVLQQSQFGLFNYIRLSELLAFVIAFALLDLAVWVQHVVMHRVSWLWRLHRVHHTDPGFDVTTALRFHPLELLLSLAWKGSVIILLGASPEAVAAFVIILNAAAMFNHANLDLPLWLDRWLRLIIVTPDMHRVHHSTDYSEANRNFGFFLPWWDRLFGLYKAAPNDGHETMSLGSDQWREAADQSPIALLRQPFEGR